MEELSVRVESDMGLQDSHRHLQAGQVAQGVISAVINACQQDANFNPDGPMRFTTFLGEDKAHILRQLWMKHLRILTSESEPNVLPIANTIPDISTAQSSSSSTPSLSDMILPVPAFRTEVDGIRVRTADIQDLGGSSSSSGLNAASAWNWQGASAGFGDPVAALGRGSRENAKSLLRPHLQYQGTSQLSYEFSARVKASSLDVPGHLSASASAVQPQLSGLTNAVSVQGTSGLDGFNLTIPIGDADSCSDTHSRYLGFPFLGLKLLVNLSAVNTTPGALRGVSEWMDARVVHLTFLSERGRKAKSSRRSPAISRLTHVLLRLCEDGRELSCEWPSECLRHAVEGSLDQDDEVASAPAKRSVAGSGSGSASTSARAEIRINPSLADLMREADAEKFGSLDSPSDSESESNSDSESESDRASAARGLRKDASQSSNTASTILTGNVISSDSDDDDEDDDDESGFDPHFLQEYRRNFRHQVGLRALLRMDDRKFEQLRHLAGINGGSSAKLDASDDIASFWKIGQLSLIDKQRLRARVQEAESHWQDRHAELLANPGAAPRVLVVAHDNTLLSTDRPSVVDASGLLKREYYTRGLPLSSNSGRSGQAVPALSADVANDEPEERAESAAGIKGTPMMHGVCHQRIRLRTGGFDGNTRFRLRNAFVGNRGGLQLSLHAEVDSTAPALVGNTRKCMVLPEIVVELDTQKHFGKSRGGLALATETSVLREKKRRRQ